MRRLALRREHGMTNPTPVFKRILLKLSGEALAANQGFGVSTERIHGIAAEIGEVLPESKPRIHVVK